MNKKQVAFIICSNNDMYYQECVRYIQDLKVPIGYETDILCVQEAESMTKGYNAGMQASNAKYKVYLHQDTFILNENFIYDILEIFNTEKQIGMIGVLGSDKLPEDANCYLGWNVGFVEVYNGRMIHEIELQQNASQLYTPVKAVDGFMMVTQYDVPWREDILDGWDFYDVSQSLEMQRHGYEVVVPYQKQAWCYHDCGVSKLQQYDYYRERMMRAYPEVFTGYIDRNETRERLEQIEKGRQIYDAFVQLIEAKAYEQIVDISQEVREIIELDASIYEMTDIAEIYEIEKSSLSGVITEWFGFSRWSEIHEYYTWVRWILIRINFGKADERIELLKKKYQKGKISEDAIQIVFRGISNKNVEVFDQGLEIGMQREENIVQIAYCIPTYDHPEIIEAVLKKNGELYKRYGIDIYIYDSSPNELTEQAVKKMIVQGMSNLFYVRLDEGISIDEKLILIFSKYGMKKEYKYIWPSKDRVIFEEKTIQGLVKEARINYDVILLRTAVYPESSDVYARKDIVYYSAEEFYVREGWLVTSLHATVFNVDKMLEEIDWDEFRTRYFFDGESQFDHFAILFHQLGMKDACVIKVMGQDRATCYEHAKGKSMWLKETFHVWGELWPMTNDALPECYGKYKDEVIKRTASLPWLLGSDDSLITLKIQGVLTKDVYEKLKRTWHRVSSISREKLKSIVDCSMIDLKELEDAFWSEIDRLFALQKYEEVCTIICQSTWIGIYDKTGKYATLTDCMHIFIEELKGNSRKNLFVDSGNICLAIRKVEEVKKRFVQFEKGRTENEMENILQYIIQNRISTECIMYIISKFCIDRERILEEFLNCCEGKNGSEIKNICTTI